MRYKWLLDNLSGVGTVHRIHIETVNPQAFEPSPHESFHSKMMDLWGEGATEEGKNLG